MPFSPFLLKKSKSFKFNYKAKTITLHFGLLMKIIGFSAILLYICCKTDYKKFNYPGPVLWSLAPSWWKLEWSVTQTFYQDLPATIDKWFGQDFRHPSCYVERDLRRRTLYLYLAVFDRLQFNWNITSPFSASNYCCLHCNNN
jgi:hypothetical protein